MCAGVAHRLFQTFNRTSDGAKALLFIPLKLAGISVRREECGMIRSLVSVCKFFYVIIGMRRDSHLVYRRGEYITHECGSIELELYN